MKKILRTMLSMMVFTMLLSACRLMSPPVDQKPDATVPGEKSAAVELNGEVESTKDVAFGNDFGRLDKNERSETEEIMLAEDVASPLAMKQMYAGRSTSGRRQSLAGSAPASASTLRSSGSGMEEVDPWMELDEFSEVWVIEKPDAAVDDSDRPTQGELKAIVDDQLVPCPLQHTAVKATIAGFISSVEVVQQYQNPFESKVEAVYVFPLPESAAVNDFVMQIGDRRIRGIIREKEEAKRVYQEAKAQGYRAALLTQERPNVFQQKVANIEPGKQIDIHISYFHPLPLRDGEYEFVFPMVVGPRFNPPGSTNGIGAVARGSAGSSGQPVDVPYLKPDERTGHDIDVEVMIQAGMPIHELRSRTHVIETETLAADQMRVRLKSSDTIPNKDFVLRYRLAGESLGSALLTQEGEGDWNTFALFLQPPEATTYIQPTGRELVFVLDCSGSMSGYPMQKAKQAIQRCLSNLNPQDTFQIIRFSERAGQLGDAPIPATPENIEKARKYVEALHGGGGTMMLEGIKAALDFPHDPERLRYVTFMTDGYIGNEADILAAIKEKLDAARIFSFGVGSSVNRYLLERMAVFGRGAVAFITMDESAGEKVDQFYQRIAYPALRDIQLNWGSVDVADVYPRQIPDVFVGRPVLITGRYRGDWSEPLTVAGRTGSETRRFEVEPDADADHSGVASLWARWRIRDLSHQEITDPSAALRQQILETSLAHQVLCRYSAFLAVDASEVTEGDHGYTVHVPVPVPDGVRYDTTVSP